MPPAYGVDVEVRGDSSSATASNRGQYGVRVLAETYAHDMSQADSTWNDGLRGGAVQGVQEGLDPAGTFIRRAGGNGNPDMLFPAALYVASLGDIDHVGAATGMTLEGDLFLPGHQSSGIYTGGTGTFNELRPGYTDLAVDPPPPFGVMGRHGWAAPTWWRTSRQSRSLTPTSHNSTSTTALWWI